MTRTELENTLEETITDVTDLPKKNRDRLIDSLVEVLTGDVGLELDDEDDDEDDE